MTNRSKTNLKKKGSLKQKRKSPWLMPPVAKNKTFDTSTEIENASVDFNTLCYPKENINTCNTSNESEYGKVISP